MFSPIFLANQGIPVETAMQFSKEAILTFPRGYHSIINTGASINEAIKVATKSWLPYGMARKICECNIFYSKISTSSDNPKTRTVFRIKMLTQLVVLHKMLTLHVFRRKARLWKLIHMFNSILLMIKILTFTRNNWRTLQLKRSLTRCLGPEVWEIINPEGFMQFEARDAICVFNKIPAREMWLCAIGLPAYIR